MRGYLAVTGVLALAMAGCSSEPAAREPDYGRPLPPGRMALRKITDPARIPNFAPGFADRESLILAIDRSLDYLARPSSRKHYPYMGITHEQVVRSLRTFKRILAEAGSGAELHRRIVETFDLYESVGWDGSGTVLFTAYCEPVYEGSRRRTAIYRHPLYRMPPDLVKAPDGTPLGRRTRDGRIVPYYTRREIEDHPDLLRGLELVYLKDPVEAFIIHVQGSARIRLPDGSEMRVGYKAKTDRPYTSIGRELVRDGRIPPHQLSLAAIRRFFRRHPGLVREYLDRNECYVFFTEYEDGPYGSLNVPITPKRTLATDKSVFPPAALAFVETRMPLRTLSPEPFRAFMLDQDTGGAIRSAGRADIYYGSGPEAEARAGRTCAEGRLVYLFVKPARVAVSRNQ